MRKLYVNSGWVRESWTDTLLRHGHKRHSLHRACRSSHSEPSSGVACCCFNLSPSGVVCLCGPWDCQHTSPQNGWLKTANIHPCSLRLGDRMSGVKGSQGLVPAEAPGEGPSRLFQLPGAPGVHPWAASCLRPIPASVSTGLLLCVPVSPLLCLIRTLSLGLGPPPSRRTSSQTFTPSRLQRACFHQAPTYGHQGSGRGCLSLGTSLSLPLPARGQC